MAGPDAMLMSALASALARGPALEIAVLFGSRATPGRERPDSDVDVGIVPVDGALSLHDELELASSLSGALGMEVDLVRLDGDEPLLGREVALRGVCVLERSPGVFAAWRARWMSRFADFEEIIAPHRERFLRRLAEGSR